MTFVSPLQPVAEVALQRVLASLEIMVAKVQVAHITSPIAPRNGEENGNTANLPSKMHPLAEKIVKIC